MRIITHDSTFESWRNHARNLLEEKVHYNEVVWQSDRTGSLFDFIDTTPLPQASRIKIPRDFIQDAEFVAAFRDESTWPLLYKLAYRIVYEEKNLMHISLDDDVLDFHRRMKLVSRDLHKVRAFVRFKEIKENDKSIYMAWHRPDHRVLKFSAAFFTNRFNGMNWIIFTEDESMSWIDNQLSFGPGISQQEAQAFDQTEELWKTYYGSIFNPGRLKVKMMKKELPVRHWKTLPETEIIDQLIADAPKRLEEFYESQRPSAIQWIPKEATLLELEAALPNCKACGLCDNNAIPVLGMGLANADIVFVLEQPGQEDELKKSLMENGILEENLYFTSSVKAAKKKRPTSFEIGACRPWLKAQLELIKPRILVCVGASAAQSVVGKKILIHEMNGKFFSTHFSEQTIVLQKISDTNLLPSLIAK